MGEIPEKIRPVLGMRAMRDEVEAFGVQVRVPARAGGVDVFMPGVSRIRGSDKSTVLSDLRGHNDDTDIGMRPHDWEHLDNHEQRCKRCGFVMLTREFWSNGTGGVFYKDTRLEFYFNGERHSKFIKDCNEALMLRILA